MGELYDGVFKGPRSESISCSFSECPDEVFLVKKQETSSVQNASETKCDGWLSKCW